MLSLTRRHKQRLKNDGTVRFHDCIGGINNTFLRDRHSHSKLFRLRGKNVVRKTGVYLLCGGIALLVIVFIAGAVAGSKQGRAKLDTEYEDRLAAIAIINADLQDQNNRLTDLNKSLTERLGVITERLGVITDRLTKAENIIGELDFRASTDGNTVQRIIDNLEKLDRAVQALIVVQ